MMSTHVPSGIEDLAAQAADLEQQRAELERQRAEVAEQRAAAPAVIDPDGQEFELNEDGSVWKDEDGNPVPKWPHRTTEVKGRTIQIRTAGPSAMQAFAMAISKYTPPKAQQDMTVLFVRNHVSPRSYGELMVAMLDPDDPFTMEDFGELVQAIAKEGTARPTKPSHS